MRPQYSAAMNILKRTLKREISMEWGRKHSVFDVREKVLGYGEYPERCRDDGMVYASAVRSKYPRARILGY